MGVERVGDARELGAPADERRDVARGRGLERRELVEQHLGGGLDAAQRLDVEPVDRRQAIEELLARHPGLLGALVAKRHEGRHPAGRHLIDVDRGVERADARRADHHDGGDGHDEDERRNQPRSIEKIPHGGLHHGRAPGPARREAADEELELVADGHSGILVGRRRASELGDEFLQRDASLSEDSGQRAGLHFPMKRHDATG